MNKKILSAFTAICVLFTVTGCGSSTSAPAQGADAETVSDAPVKEDASTEEAEKADGEESGEADEAEDGSGEEVTGQYSFKDGDDEYKLDFDFDTDEFINDLEMKELYVIANPDPQKTMPKLMSTRFDKVALVKGVE